jgi:hypothetical protein
MTRSAPTSREYFKRRSATRSGCSTKLLVELTELAGAKTPRGRAGLLRDREHVQDPVARQAMDLM